MYILTPDHQIIQLHGNSEIDYALQVQDNTSFYDNFQERTILKTKLCANISLYKEALYQHLTCKLGICVWLYTFTCDTFGRICFILHEAHFTVPASLGFLELVQS